MSEAPDVRRQPTGEEKRLILENQGRRCLYCQRMFGSAVIRKGKIVWLKVTWDHVVPFSYSQNNHGHNFAAACQICNGLKGSLMFATIEEARTHILALLEVQELDPDQERRVGSHEFPGGT
jgi:5-methylcytosine-specific restriction endonuclease McrA